MNESLPYWCLRGTLRFNLCLPLFTRHFTFTLHSSLFEGIRYGSNERRQGLLRRPRSRAAPLLAYPRSRRPRHVSLHAWTAGIDVPWKALDHAAIRGLLDGCGVECPLSLPAGARDDRP